MQARDADVPCAPEVEMAAMPQCEALPELPPAVTRTYPAMASQHQRPAFGITVVGDARTVIGTTYGNWCDSGFHLLGIDIDGALRWVTDIAFVGAEYRRNSMLGDDDGLWVVGADYDSSAAWRLDAEGQVLTTFDVDDRVLTLVRSLGVDGFVARDDRILPPTYVGYAGDGSELWSGEHDLSAASVIVDPIGTVTAFGDDGTPSWIYDPRRPELADFPRDVGATALATHDDARMAVVGSGLGEGGERGFVVALEPDGQLIWRAEHLHRRIGQVVALGDGATAVVGGTNHCRRAAWLSIYEPDGRVRAEGAPTPSAFWGRDAGGLLVGVHVDAQAITVAWQEAGN